jgi:hypothetical protein
LEGPDWARLRLKGKGRGKVRIYSHGVPYLIPTEIPRLWSRSCRPRLSQKDPFSPQSSLIYFAFAYSSPLVFNSRHGPRKFQTPPIRRQKRSSQQLIRSTPGTSTRHFWCFVAREQLSNRPPLRRGSVNSCVLQGL